VLWVGIHKERLDRLGEVVTPSVDGLLGPKAVLRMDVRTEGASLSGRTWNGESRNAWRSQLTDLSLVKGLLEDGRRMSAGECKSEGGSHMGLGYGNRQQCVVSRRSPPLSSLSLSNDRAVLLVCCATE
jgi:hypothetical protein